MLPQTESKTLCWKLCSQNCIANFTFTLRVWKGGHDGGGGGYMEHDDNDDFGHGWSYTNVCTRFICKMMMLMMHYGKK